MSAWASAVPAAVSGTYSNANSAVRSGPGVYCWGTTGSASGAAWFHAVAS